MTSLFAALDIATGAAIGKCYKRHRTTEFLDFLKKIDEAVPEGPDVHLVMDKYATHKTPKIKAWLARRLHWHIHFTPTSASWINQVARWFAELTRKQLQHDVHRSIAELEADITAFIEAHNENPVAGHARSPYRRRRFTGSCLYDIRPQLLRDRRRDDISARVSRNRCARVIRQAQIFGRIGFQPLRDALGGEAGKLAQAAQI